MHVFSTVLFVDGCPVGYKVFREADRLFLNPAENPNREVLPPALRVHQEEGRWLIEGTADQDLIDQVIEDVSNAGFSSTHSLTAAP